MTAIASQTIHIAAALIDDGRGQILLVRKRGTFWFMQAGGKIEDGEGALLALSRELREEIGVTLDERDARYLGCFTALAANEVDSRVEAELFHLRLAVPIIVGCEIEESTWVNPDAAEDLMLAPLTRQHVLPLARRL